VIDYYYRLRSGGQNIHDYLKDSNWEEFVYYDYYSFEVAPLSNTMWSEHHALSQVNNEFPIKQVGLIRMPPNSGYDWHVDTDRTVGMNMLVGDVHCCDTLFSKNYSRGLTYDITRLEYQPWELYVFNTKIYHTVLNYQHPRYLFTVEFEKRDQTSYAAVRDFCLSQGL